MYADVEEAVRSGSHASGLEHWLEHGRKEGRLAGRSLENLTVVLRAQISRIERGKENIGRTPPMPNTLRGRLGAALARIVQRAFASHAEQVRSVVDTLLRALKEQLAETEFLADHFRRNSRANADLGRRLETERAAREALESRLETERAAREALEGRLAAQTEVRSFDENRWHAEIAAREAVERSLRAEIGARETLARRVDATESQLGESSEQLRVASRYAHQAKAEMSFQQQRVSILIEEARKRLPHPFIPEQLNSIVAEDAHQLDALYASFEDIFRGTREDIKERQRVYLPYIRQAGAGTDRSPVLDLGCGRGEWLELLNEDSLVGRGLDSNLVMLERCRLLGFDVEDGDVIEYLRKLPDCSLGAVTGFHIIEHLPFRTLLALVDETTRVLRPGGLAIFETPNPSNVVVGAHTFYTDPTHLRPLPSSMMRFIAEARGLCHVEILALHPDPEAAEGASDLAHEGLVRIAKYFYGPRDYAILGWKA